MENLILKTKQWFQLSKSKPEVREVVGEKHQQRLKPKKVFVSLSFAQLSNRALLDFSKNVISCMCFSTHSALEKTKLSELMYSVAEFESTLAQWQVIKNEVVYFNLQKCKSQVVKLLSELAKGRQQKAGQQPEYARIIITVAGFDIKN